jgi:ribose/xylose/arabinose/galactoside ABC-type transport system permease subunit
MAEQIIASHSILVNIFLTLLLAGFSIPMVTARRPLSFKKASFIYTMIFQAIATMVAFTGLIAMVIGEISLSIGIIMMIVIWAILMFVEIKKYRLIKVAKIENPEIHRVLKSGFLKISVIQSMLIAVMIALMMLKAKGIVGI